MAVNIDLTTNDIDPGLFFFKDEKAMLHLLFYVDEILQVGNNPAKMLEIKQKLMKDFKMKDLVEPGEFLGIIKYKLCCD